MLKVLLSKWKMYLYGSIFLSFVALAGYAGFMKLSLSEANRVIDQLDNDLAVALLTVEAQRKSAEALDAHIRRTRVEAERWEKLAQEFSKLEGSDAPLNSYGRAVLDSVSKE